MKGRGWGCGGQIEPPPPEKATFKKSSLIRVKLILSLPKKFNLYYWNITEDNQCFLCHHMQTQLQVMSNCEKNASIDTLADMIMCLIASYNYIAIILQF